MLNIEEALKPVAPARTMPSSDMCADGPVEGVKYKATLTNTGRIQLDWRGGSRDAWMRVLNAVRGLERRSYDVALKKWSVPDDPKSVDAIARLGFVVGSGGGQVSDEAIEKAREDAAERARKAKLASVVPPYVREYALAPEVVPDYDVLEEQRRDMELIDIDPSRAIIPGLRGYQVDFLRFMEAHNGRALLGDDMGTGKTLQALAYMAYANDFPALIVVNAPTKMQWAREYYRWVSQCKSCVCSVQILCGKKPHPLDCLSSYIINWDILDAWLPVLKKHPFKLLVGDEVQAIGNPSSLRAKAFRSLSATIPHIVCMSGTPARSKPLQFWTCLHCIDKDAFPSYEGYKYRYCLSAVTDYDVKFDGVSNAKELHAMLAKRMLRRTKDEVMSELPPKTISVVPLETDAGIMRQYEAEERSLATMKTAQEMREKIASMMSTAYASKEKALLEWVKQFLESGEKLVLFAWHRDVVDVLCSELKRYCPAKIYGGTALKDREDARERFISDPSCRIIIGNIQSLGTGVDGLQKASCNVAFAEFSYTPTDMEQAADRLHRGGQSRPVTVHYLIAPGTVDDDSVEVLDERKKMLSAVMDGKSAADVDLIGEIMERMGLRQRM